MLNRLPNDARFKRADVSGNVRQFRHAYQIAWKVSTSASCLGFVRMPWGGDQIALSAVSRSRTISSTSSIPTEILTIPSVIPIVLRPFGPSAA